MSNRLLLLIILILSVNITGCNLPDSGDANPGAIASQVAQLLTKTPDFDIPMESPTAVPTITIQFTEEVIPTVVTASPTQEPSLTPTLLPQGIPSGSPDWTDPLTDGSRFGINPGGYDDGQTKIDVSDSSLIMTSISALGWRGWRLASQKPDNYYLQATFQTKDCAGSDQYGLVIQSPDYESGFGYYFGLTCDGRYAFQKWEESGLTNLQGWINDPNIIAGPDQTNTIGVMKSGNQYNLYINAVSIVTVNDGKFSSPGYFGPYIAGVITPNFSFKMDEISYWKLP